MDTPFVNGWAKEDACNNGPKLLKMYPKYSKKAFDNIVTGDETWVYYFEPKRKVANRIWATKNARRTSIAKRIRTVKKVLHAIFSLIRVQLFKSRCQKAERSQASSIKTLFWENWRTTTKVAAPKQDLSMSDFCMIMHPLTRHVLWLTFWSQRRLPSFRNLRIHQTWPPATIFSFQNLNIIYLEGDTIREMPLDLLFISVWWVSPLKSMKNASKNGLTG